MVFVEDLTKVFRVYKREAGLKNAARSFLRPRAEEIRALDGVSFKIGGGEIVGYIGPNGAGKSTTIKIMCGILTPSGGNCVINGLVPYRDRKAHVKNIGVVFGQRSQLLWDIPVADSFELLRSIYRVSRDEYKKSLDELCCVLDLSELIKIPTRQLSLGQRMRCEIAASLLHRPDIVFLDEPTIGLDAVTKIAVREFIKRRNTQFGTTVILTTHDMQDIDALCDRVIMIGRGKILLDGRLNEIKRRYSAVKKLSVEYSGEGFELPRGITLEKELPGKMDLLVDTSVLTVPEAVFTLAHRANVTDISVREANVEEIVVGLYRELEIV